VTMVHFLVLGVILVGLWVVIVSLPWRFTVSWIGGAEMKRESVKSEDRPALRRLNISLGACSRRLCGFRSR
jgi:hypothetical protein